MSIVIMSKFNVNAAFVEIKLSLSILFVGVHLTIYHFIFMVRVAMFCNVVYCIVLLCVFMLFENVGKALEILLRFKDISNKTKVLCTYAFTKYVHPSKYLDIIIKRYYLPRRIT